MSAPAALPAIKTTLIDITKCIGCHACQVACKQWNERDGEETELAGPARLPEPGDARARRPHADHGPRARDEGAPEGLAWVFAMRRCLHCLEPACVSACPTTALERQPDGPVTYDADKCIGCRYCVLACPWGVPTAEWDIARAEDREVHALRRPDRASPRPSRATGRRSPQAETSRFLETIMTPACVKACPADACASGRGTRCSPRRTSASPASPDEVRRPHLRRARGRRHERRSTSRPCPFEKLGFPDVGTKSYPGVRRRWRCTAVPPAVMAVGAFLGMAYSVFRRRVAAVAAHGGGARRGGARPPPGVRDAAREALDAVQPAPRRAHGVRRGLVRRALRRSASAGAPTSPTPGPWGLWIVFDLVWIAVAAGAFAIGRPHLRLPAQGPVRARPQRRAHRPPELLLRDGDAGRRPRPAVALLQLGLQAPEHSAMFEVSWCVGLYVTILLFEFLPVPLERWGLTKAMERGRSWSGAYVVVAVTLFVFMLSRNSCVRGRRRRRLRDARLGLPRGRAAGRADHARDRGRDALDHAPELARLALPPHAGPARAAVVVADAAGLLLPVVDRGRDGARHPHGDVDREGLAPAAADGGSSPRRPGHVLVAPRLPRLPPRRPRGPRSARWRVLGTARPRSSRSRSCSAASFRSSCSAGPRSARARRSSSGARSSPRSASS